jgi:hypothetical protein
MKVRCPPILQVAPGSVTGPVREHDDLPDVFHIANCSSSCSLGINFEFKNVDPPAGLSSEALVFQACWIFLLN